MPEPIPGYDDWKLDNGPYEDDGDHFDDPIEAHDREEDR